MKLGGHLLPPTLDDRAISRYTEKIRNIGSKVSKLVVVVGGGEIARKYIDTARALGASERLCDVVGIEVTRLNARLLIPKLGKETHPTPITSIKELRRKIAKSKLLVMGGLEPGQSTAGVAALSAETICADLLIIATNVDGVYTDDPKVVPTAKKIDEITPQTILRMISGRKRRAGGYKLLDSVALESLIRSKIKTYVIDGRKMENFDKALGGERVGTLIVG